MATLSLPGDAPLAALHGGVYMAPHAAAQAADAQPPTDRRGRITVAAVRELFSTQPENFPGIRLPTPATTAPAMSWRGLMDTFRQAGVTPIELIVPPALRMPTFDTNEGSILETEDEM